LFPARHLGTRRLGQGYTRMSKSSLALSNLRAFVILIVVAFHSALAYLGSQPASSPPFDNPPYHWKAFPILDSERWFGFDLFCASQYVYLMHIMFFLSGLFVWSSLQRKGTRRFLYDRFLRLGVPFVLGVCLLMPVAHYPVYRVTAVDPSWTAFWAHWIALPFWPSGPLWFLWHLLVLNTVAAGLFWLAPRSGEFLGRLSASAGDHPGRYFVGLVAISALAYVPLAPIFKPWDWVQFGPFALQPDFALHYVIYFFAGLGVGAYGIERGLLGSAGMLARRWPIWVAGAFAAFLLWIIPTALIAQGWKAAVSGLEIIADLGLVLSCAGMSFGLAALFVRFAAKQRPGFDSLSDNAYGIYLVHYVFVIWLQYLLLGVAMFAIAKGAIVFGATVILSWVTAAAVCRLPVGARLLGADRRVFVRAP
jgi:glucan biosynthesis protein C